MKNVLVVGSGGREHALVWQLKRSPQVGKVFCAPGNAGIAADAECVDIKVNELEKLADFAQQHKVDLTVVGPEAPLCDGIVDVFQARKLAIFGPDKEAAQLEGSKDYAKRFMVKYGIPTAESETFEDADSACEYIEKQFAAGKKGIVVKADGLAAGKGVLVAENLTGAVDFVRDECFGGGIGKVFGAFKHLLSKGIHILSCDFRESLGGGDVKIGAGGGAEHKSIGQNGAAENSCDVFGDFNAVFAEETVDYGGGAAYGLIAEEDGRGGLHIADSVMVDYLQNFGFFKSGNTLLTLIVVNENKTFPRHIEEVSS